MSIFENIRTLASSAFNPHLEAARRAGAPVIGYFCSYVPDEIIHAAGGVPYRMRATETAGTTMGDAWYSSINCTFARHCFDKALRGRFDFLDGIVFMNGCDHLRRMYDNWRYADIPPAFRHMFVTPHVISENSLEQYRKECAKLIRALEAHFKISVTDEKLRESVRLYDRKRSLLGELYELRRGEALPIRGSEFLSLLLAVTAVPVEKAIEILTETIQAARGRDVSRQAEVRVFLAAGHVEEIDHLELLEECGAAVVCDNMCIGLRHFDGLAGERDDVLGAISRRYLQHLSCPRMVNDFRRRLAHVQETIKAYGARAVILEKLKFCDLWGGEAFIWRRELTKHGIPILVLERELYGGGTGQLKTRLQAFFEQVCNRQAADCSITGTAAEYRKKS
jgi:benzoyl-CoA reductase/2-hydroxyglutaryl-CoA dehydratase subunit BcrC/BadD/HgdB